MPLSLKYRHGVIKLPLFTLFRNVKYYAFWCHFKSRTEGFYLYFCQEIVLRNSSEFNLVSYGFSNVEFS